MWDGVRDEKWANSYISARLCGPRKALHAVAGQLLFLNIVGKMTAFLFLALLVDCLQHVCPVQDVPHCVCSHYGRQGGRGRRSLVPVQLTTVVRKVSLGCGRTPPPTRPPTGPRQGDGEGG